MISRRLNPPGFPVVTFFVFLLMLALVAHQADGLENPADADVSMASPASGDGTSLQREAQPRGEPTPASEVIERIGKIMDESAQTMGNGQRESDDGRAGERWGGLNPGAFLWLAALVLAIVGGGWYLRRFVSGKVSNAGGQIRVVASCPLSPRSRVFIVEVGGERFLIGEGGGSVSLISRLESSSPSLNTPAVAAQDRPTEPVGVPFADRLRQWEQSVSGRSVSGEVKVSLRLLEALTRRLRRGAATQSGGSDGA
jgi:flagellar biosynthetic protein FliO